MNEREQKLEVLGYPLNRAPKPAAAYRPVIVHGKTVYVSGAIPLDGDALVYKGKVPSQISLEEAQKAAALCAANNLRMVYQSIGSLDRIERIIRVTGYVNSDPTFTDQHLVINGASQLLIDVFGNETGLAARSAVGAAQLPLGSSVEVEMILSLKQM